MSHKPSENIPKIYPQATDQIAEIMGLSKDSHIGDTPHVEHAAVADLPIAEAHGHESHGSPHIPHIAVHGDDESHADETTTGLAFVNAFKIAVPYILVFAVGIFVYFFFFSKVDLTALFKTREVAKTVKDTAMEELQKQNVENYNKWIAGYYFDVSDSKILDMNADNSGNGLSNFQKFMLNLNPKSYDSAGLGRADSETLNAGINPLSGRTLNDRQKQLIERYIDMETVMNKLALSKMKNSGSVAGVQTVPSSGMSGGDPVVTGTAPGSQTPANSASEVITLHADIEINTDIPARVEIPSIGVNVPIIWSKAAEDFDKDLQSGVIHYPGTALPGQVGTSYISGHSSNYAWARGEFNKVFSKLGDLPKNTSFKITVVQKNGKDAILHYVVTESKEFAATDPAQFQNGGNSVVALSTCWPIGTTQRRLVVFGQLTQVEK